MKELEVGALYKHYKGRDYKAIGIARHSETLEELVIYKKEYGDDGYWVRPKDEFLGNVIIDGKEVERFKKIG